MLVATAFSLWCCAHFRTWWSLFVAGARETSCFGGPKSTFRDRRKGSERFYFEVQILWQVQHLSPQPPPSPPTTITSITTITTISTFTVAITRFLLLHLWTSHTHTVWAPCRPGYFCHQIRKAPALSLEVHKSYSDLIARVPSEQLSCRIEWFL